MSPESREDKPLKSAYELAMERLQAEDRSQGKQGPRTLTDEQKKAIAEIRRNAEARLAEIEILRADRQAEAAGDPTKLAEEEEHHRIDRRRIEDERDSAIEKIKNS